jgi:hypothetical protein
MLQQRITPQHTINKSTIASTEVQWQQHAAQTYNAFISVA